ncbi:L-threonine 3-dehydrogenase [Tuberibacillus sp. Marseille-P3662]|uniref:L-threonine 3-dehydrogenase n=1 Tax=Tuberibacillus sp. Marseille-P3662 TaxID=1965358 RepID=UPI0020CAF4D7|nr:L-threonine 3-dehydrogenase [Tuberibacillus sp. Marseille-P3662]
MEGKMKAIIKHHRGYGAELQMVDIPQISPDEVLIKVNATSICGTDVHIYTWDDWAASRVQPPYVFGHEFSGEVVELGRNVDSVNVGDRVSAETHIVCGTCKQCLEGKYHICQNTQIIGVDRNGCFAEYVALPAKNLWRNSQETSDNMASVQEPMGNALQTVFASDVAAKDVAIIGCGPIGLMAVGIAKAAGARQVIAIDLNDYRLDLAEKMGATTILHAGNTDPIAEVYARTHDNGVDVACEMSGAPIAVKQALQMTTNGGDVNILSLPTQDVPVNFTDDVVFKGLKIQGITGRKIFETWQRVSGLLASGQVDLTPMMTHELPLEDFDKGFELMVQGQCGKVVLRP